MEITSKELSSFQDIIRTFKRETELPKRDRWKDLNNNELWLHLVGQINVVGGVDGNNRFWNRPDL